MFTKQAKLALISVALAFIAVCVVASCAERQITTAYKTAGTSYAAYDTSLSIMGDLYRAGFVTEEQKAKAIEYGRLYKAAHNDAVEALAQLRENMDNKDAQQVYFKAVTIASSALSKFLGYVAPFIAKGGN